MKKRYTILHNLGRDWKFTPGALYGVGYSGEVEIHPSAAGMLDGERAAWAVVAKHNRDDRPDGQDAPSFSSGDIVVIYDDELGLTNEYASTGTEMKPVSGLPKWVVRPAELVKVGALKLPASELQHAVESRGNVFVDALDNLVLYEDRWAVDRWIMGLLVQRSVRTQTANQWDKVREAINA